VRRNGIRNRLGDVRVTSTETRDSWSERVSPRNWSLAWKLVAVGLVPAVLAIVLGVLRVADQAQTASELGTANRLIEARGRVADAAGALRVERDRATTFVAERRLGDRGPLQEAAAQSDSSWEQARGGLGDLDDLDATTRSALDEADSVQAGLPQLRDEVAGTAPVETRRVVERYTAAVASVDVLARTLLRQVRTPQVAGLADALTATTQGYEAVARQHTILGAALRVGKVTDADRSAVIAADNSLNTSYSSYQLALPPGQTPINYITSGANAEREADQSTILAAPAPGPISVTVDRWDDVSRATTERIDAATNDVRTALTAAGEAEANRASNLAGINAVLLMLGLLLAATIIMLVSRGLTRSLRVLRTSALDVAQRRLPQAVESMRSGGAPDVDVEPVPLQNRDEVGQVARAFDAVHGQALRLAADQAALQTNVSSMFVNLSRRSQALVERQLQLIEQLESNEQDPDQLSNLFQLDHLATRMRRNSENLLVLAGTDVAKRSGAPVPLVDVLRAAVSEIEQYQRIVVQAPPQAMVVGRATSDIVHLLAELLDNATNFSPPDSQVVMSSTRMPDGSVLVEIADRGVGMVEQELGDANRRLTTPSAVDVSASRRMGLFVVGRLGARHGIPVHLGGAPTGGPGGGVTASVTLPAHLVVSSGEPADPQPRSLPAAAVAASGAGRNGVLPQRTGSSVRPAPRPALPAKAEAPQPLRASGGANGLPTRTPGSSLRRDRVTGESPIPFAAAPAGSTSNDRARRPDDEPAGTGQRPGPDTDANAPEPLAADTGTDEGRERVDAGEGDAAEPDATPTEAVPLVAAERGAQADGAAERPASDTGDAASDGAPAKVTATDWAMAQATAADDVPEKREATDDEWAAPAAAARNDDGSTDTPVEAPADTAAPNGGPAGRPFSPRPRPTPAPNGSHRDRVPSTPYRPDGDTAPNGTAGIENGDNGIAPPTRPLPAMPPSQPAPAASVGTENTADELFAASVPAISEPDGLPRARRPIGELRRSPAAVEETTPIFAEIASAWFAENRPVPVDWELGKRPGAEFEPDAAPPVNTANGTAAPEPAPAEPAERLDAADRSAEQAADQATAWSAEQAADQAVSEPPAESFATAADEGWRAASGAAAERPDEVTAAGLPKRRPRARLVPGSAGSAVLAAAAPPTRSAESIRGRLASYQQGVRQGRENRLRREVSGTGPQTVSTEENGAAPAGGEHDEESR
jgi:signal transduction histidine kinase